MDNLKPHFIQGAALFFEYTSQYQYQSIKVSNLPRSPSIMNVVIKDFLEICIFHIFKITWLWLFLRQHLSLIDLINYYFLLDFQHFKKCACLMSHDEKKSDTSEHQPFQEGLLYAFWTSDLLVLHVRNSFFRKILQRISDFYKVIKFWLFSGISEFKFAFRILNYALVYKSVEILYYCNNVSRRYIFVENSWTAIDFKLNFFDF